MPNLSKVNDPRFWALWQAAGAVGTIKKGGIDQALSAGYGLHAFLSGGGLRVIRIEEKGQGALKGYGEHLCVEDALEYAGEDFLAGRRPYKEVYGGIYSNYLTVQSMPNSPLDQWLKQGHTFDAWQNKERVVVQLKGLTEIAAPEDIVDEVLHSGTSRIWKNRGYTYFIEKFRLPNGEFCVSIGVIQNPLLNSRMRSRDPWTARIVKTGYGINFSEAMKHALKAKEVEVDRRY